MLMSPQGEESRGTWPPEVCHSPTLKNGLIISRSQSHWELGKEAHYSARAHSITTRTIKQLHISILWLEAHHLNKCLGYLYILYATLLSVIYIAPALSGGIRAPQLVLQVFEVLPPFSKAFVNFWFFWEFLGFVHHPLPRLWAPILFLGPRKFSFIIYIFSFCYIFSSVLCVWCGRTLSTLVHWLKVTLTYSSAFYRWGN